GGRAIVYSSSLRSSLLGPQEVPAAVDPVAVEEAIESAGLERMDTWDVGLEFGSWSEERTGEKSRRLRHIARLLSDPDRYVSRFGRRAYDVMLADCRWHVFHMIGKLSARVYLLRRPPQRRT